MSPHLLRSTSVLVCFTLLIGCGGPEDHDESPPDVDDAPGTTLTSELQRDLEPEVEADDFSQFTADNRDFAFSVVDQLHDEQEDDENIFISPHSISIALAMTYGGAKNNTKTEMAEVLRFGLDDELLHRAFNKLDLDLDKRSEVETDGDDERFELDVVNRTWGQQDFDFRDDYLDLLALNYGASMNVVDFITEYESIREAINQWVEKQTNDRIRNLLPPDSLSELTRFVLVNAVYFYGSWEHPFSDDLTSEADFHLLDGSTTEVSMMTQNQRLPFYEGDDTVAVSLPYVGNEVSLVAVMPADDGDDFLSWEADFDRQAFDEVTESLSTTEGRVYFPHIEDEGAYSLGETFKDMGMIDAFDQCNADFQGITGHPPCQNFKSLYISSIFHKSFVSIDELGTEAAAATAVVMDTPGSAPMDPPELRFDRPFYYAIYDHPTDTILFLGRMVDPS